MTEIRVPLSEIEFSYARSSGPGGQNVNKVSTKAVLRWNLAESPALSAELRSRLILRLSSKLTKEGHLVITSDRFRDQSRNREDCLAKLHALVAAAAYRPAIRKKTKPTASSKRQRVKSKKLHSDKKRLRSFRSDRD